MGTRSEMMHVSTDAAPQQRELDLFRGVVRSLAQDASDVVTGLMASRKSVSDVMEAKLYLVHHYLDYMKRLCDGVA